MKHISWKKTGQFRNVIHDVLHEYQFVGLDESGSAIYDASLPKPIITFTGTNKIHGCFDKNTLVTMANGERIRISELNIGDVILSYDIENDKLIEKEVTHTENNMSDKEWLKLFFDNNSYIKCTMDHKFYTTNRGWVEAQYLTADDIFVTDI